MATNTNFRVYPSHDGDRSTGVPFSREKHVNQIDSGLPFSGQGAHGIISTIAARRVVKKLFLGHNELGNSGCVTLFQFLSSQTGRRYEINEICLDYNRIGDLGLNAVATYLSGNQALRELSLQYNDFTGNPNTAKALADAVNTSHLEVLSLNSNQQLSDSFIEGFLQSLTSNHLRELHISRTGITSRSLQSIVDYLSSKRCKLSALQCNGNLLGLRAVQSIIRAIERHNYSLTSLELYCADFSDDYDEDRHGRSVMDVWKNRNLEIGHILARNKQLSRETQRQALHLLHYARTILLCTKCNTYAQKWTSIRNSSGGCFDDATMSDNMSFPFLELPLEIQFHILSFLSPILSVSQCAAIFSYATTSTTLPPLLPRLAGSTTDRKETSQVVMLYHGRISGRSASQLYESSRTEVRHQWLASVDCMLYEPRI